MARDYLTLMEKKDGDQTIWEEISVTRVQLKSMVARLTRNGRFLATDFALNDGTPLRSVEVRVDNGPGQASCMSMAAIIFMTPFITACAFRLTFCSAFSIARSVEFARWRAASAD